MEQLTVIFLGPQGSGKGTQVNLLKEFLQQKDASIPIVHLDMGAALRQFCTETGFTEDMVRASMARGELQPAFISTYVMSRFFLDSMREVQHLIVDGFPREIRQATIFDTAVRFYKREKPTLLYVNVSDEVAVERLLKRGRHDDTEESIRTRLAWSRELVNPTIEWFRANPDYRFIEIDGERTVEEIHKDILQKLELV